MDSKLQEKLNRIADLENEGYSQDIIEAVEEFIDNPEKETHTFKTVDEMWAFLNSEDENEKSDHNK